jgi:hypothetical protein
MGGGEVRRLLSARYQKEKLRRVGRIGRITVLYGTVSPVRDLYCTVEN